MTATLDSYLSLVTNEHGDQPNFLAVLTAILQPFVDGQNLIESMLTKFDVDVAVGQQLDFVGQWVGFSRNLLTPISDVYFSLDIVGLGFDEGIIWSPGDPLEGIISLDDDTYRLMIYAKIAANHWDGTLSQAEEILASAFIGSVGTNIFIQDNTDMSIDIGITGTLPSALFQALVEQDYFPIRPAAVRLNDVHIDAGPFFGFDTENYNISGFDVGIIT